MSRQREYLHTHPWLSFRHDLERADPLCWLLLGEATARCDQIAQAVLPPVYAKRLHQISMIKGAQATTAIEGNTLSEAQIKSYLEGTLVLPKSQEYLKQEVSNVLAAFDNIFEDIMRCKLPLVTKEWICKANRQLLTGLEAHLDEGVIPGEISRHSVVVFRYRGAPRQDCAFLLDQLCEWIEGEDWPVRRDQQGDRIASAILRAIYAHLYLAWIHPFGDGNGRTARLMEFMILARAGVPSPCAHLLSNHYNLTRTEYYRQLDRSTRTNPGRGDPINFLLYSLEGFVDGLREQNQSIDQIQLKLAWEHFVYNEFRRYAPSPAMRRRREAALILGQTGNVIPKKDIRDLSPSLIRLYVTKTSKTLTRDLNWLVEKDFLEITEDGYRAKVDHMHAFKFPQA